MRSWIAKILELHGDELRPVALQGSLATRTDAVKADAMNLAQFSDDSD